jgi:hypothetical protein
LRISVSTTCLPCNDGNDSDSGSGYEDTFSENDGDLDDEASSVCRKTKAHLDRRL